MATMAWHPTDWTDGTDSYELTPSTERERTPINNTDPPPSMSSGYNGRLNGGGPPVSATNPNPRKRPPKKFGLNLYQLNKPPAASNAPPVPTITTSSNAAKGNSSNGGLLLLSKKSQSSGGGLLAAAKDATTTSGASKQTAHDAFFLSAQGGGGAVDGKGDGEDGGGGKVVAPAWGMVGEKPPSQPKQVQVSSVEASMEELTLKPSVQPLVIEQKGEEEAPTLKYDEKTSLLVLAPRGSLTKQRSSVSAVSESVASAPENIADDNKKGATTVEKEELPKEDEQKQFMLKLAKDRQQQLKSEEEARALQQKERATKRLKDLESKRLEQKKEKERKHEHKLQSKKKQPQPRYDGPPTSIIIGMEVAGSKKPPPVTTPTVPSKIYSRKEVSQPTFVLEPLGKAKKIMTHSDKPPTVIKTELVEKTDKKKLYDPKRSFSSLVAGKTKHTPEIGSGSVKSVISEVSSLAGDSRSSMANSSPSLKLKKDESPPSSVRMVNLNSFEDRDRGVGRGAPSAAPRMLFDPSSGNLVAAPSGDAQHHHPQQQQQQQPSTLVKGSAKKVKQQLLQQKSPSGAGKTIDNRDTTKQKLLKKDKSLDHKSRTPPTSSRTKFPRTRGVLFRMDEHGNYVNVDECEADCGYGQHSVPGGRVKNHAAYAKLIEQDQMMQQEEAPVKSSNKLNADAPAFFGFQIQKDPTFIQQQTDFEAQQQRILEDAWSSLVEAEPSRDEDHTEEMMAQQPQEKVRQLDEYAAALAISPTMIGLGFDKEDEPIDISKFALDGDAPAYNPTNRFGSLSGGGSRLLGSSTWGTGSTGNTHTTLGHIAGLSGWTFDPNADEFTGQTNNAATTNAQATDNAAAGSANNEAANNFINLNGWGSSGFNSFGFGGNYNNNSSRTG